MEFVLALVIVVLVAWFVSAPLRNRAPAEADDPAVARLADLEAGKAAKYLQICEAEAHRTVGKLTEEDFERLDRELRAEAIDILRKIDRLKDARGRAD